jgi:hypothetical protein
MVHSERKKAATVKNIKVLVPSQIAPFNDPMIDNNLLTIECGFLPAIDWNFGVPFPSFLMP